MLACPKYTSRGIHVRDAKTYVFLRVSIETSRKCTTCIGYRKADTSQKDVGKTGFISKRGRSKFNRYWFVLKGDVLSYYNDAINVYFPRNRLNLRHAISASVVDPKDKNKEATSFILETDRKTYTFKADSAASALEWVRAIQKSIFKTHNDGHSVKISLPLKNVLDVEENPLLDFADTIKVRVIDNDETYAIDEVGCSALC